MSLHGKAVGLIVINVSLNDVIIRAQEHQHDRQVQQAVKQSEDYSQGHELEGRDEGVGPGGDSIKKISLSFCL